MYRLDYITDNGLYPVEDFLGDYICRHMTTARATASLQAHERTTPVLITRIGKHGALKQALVAMPDGTFKRPPDSQPINEREDCKAGTGVVCFCSPCRAARRLI